MRRKSNINYNLVLINFNNFVRKNYSRFDPIDNGWLTKDGFLQMLKEIYDIAGIETSVDTDKYNELFTRYDTLNYRIIMKDDMLAFTLGLHGMQNN